MTFTRHFKNITKNDAALAGGKGASLGEMTRVGIPVPPGFVLLSQAFDAFIKANGLEAEIEAALDSVNPQQMHSVEQASTRIQTLIIAAKMPSDIEHEITDQFEKLQTRYVAVRSSATAEDSAHAAWAGQLDTFLNTTQTSVLENVKKCWASLFTPRAIFYRFEKGLHNQRISVAVVIQKMVESEISGIAFSVHPVTQDRNQLIIEAAYGLGEAVVSGSITPDSYVVEKNTWLITSVYIADQDQEIVRLATGGNEWKPVTESRKDKQKLTRDQILELAKLIALIEDHYGFPVDVEWALENRKFYITQSRPITTLTA
jgi:pyruvate,water dikinase